MTMNITKSTALANLDVYGDAAPEEILLVTNQFGKDLLVRVNTDGNDHYVRLTRLALDHISNVVVNKNETSLSYEFSDKRGTGGKGGDGIYRGTKFLARDEMRALIQKQIDSRHVGIQLNFVQSSAADELITIIE